MALSTYFASSNVCAGSSSVRTSGIMAKCRGTPSLPLATIVSGNPFSHAVINGKVNPVGWPSKRPYVRVGTV